MLPAEHGRVSGPTQPVSRAPIWPSPSRARRRGPRRGPKRRIKRVERTSAGARPPRQPPPRPPSAPCDGRGSVGHGPRRADSASRAQDADSRDGCAPRHRHDGLVRRDRAGRALLDDRRAPAGPARHGCDRRTKHDAPVRASSTTPSLTAAPAPARRSSWRPLPIQRRARPPSASRSRLLPACSALDAAGCGAGHRRSARRAARRPQRLTGEGGAERASCLRSMDASMPFAGELYVLIGRSGFGGTLLNLDGGMSTSRPPARSSSTGFPLARRPPGRGGRCFAGVAWGSSPSFFDLDPSARWIEKPPSSISS